MSGVLSILIELLATASAIVIAATVIVVTTTAATATKNDDNEKNDPTAVSAAKAIKHKRFPPFCLHYIVLERIESVQNHNKIFIILFCHHS